jgi:hypothetical protein
MKKKILQLCCFSNHWGNGFEVENIDISEGKNVLDLDDNYGRDFDFILSAPPCTQFTKANNHNWVVYPELDVKIAKKCLEISLNSYKPFVLENPPGRIEKLIPALTNFRALTLNDIMTNKEWVLYSNTLLISSGLFRYRKGKSINNLTLQNRLEYPTYFIETLKQMLNL